MMMMIMMRIIMMVMRIIMLMMRIIMMVMNDEDKDGDIYGEDKLSLSTSDWGGNYDDDGEKNYHDNDEDKDDKDDDNHDGED